LVRGLSLAKPARRTRSFLVAIPKYPKRHNFSVSSPLCIVGQKNLCTTSCVLSSEPFPHRSLLINTNAVADRFAGEAKNAAIWLRPVLASSFVLLIPDSLQDSVYELVNPIPVTIKCGLET